MKKFLAMAAITAFTFGMAQETPKKSCCAGKDAKSCKMDSKKRTAKACDMKDHKDCKGHDTKVKKAEVKKAA